MTIAVFTSPPARPSQARASSGEQSTAWAIIHTALTASFALRGCTSTIRLLYTLPNRTIVAVVSMLQTNFCAVPAFIRVDPVSTSGPTSGVMAMPAACASGDPGTQVMATVIAPRRCASRNAPSVKGVVPLAASPTTMSREPTDRCAIRSAPSAGSSSSSAADSASAAPPPATMAWTSSGATPNVGGHSSASNRPIRPLLPAPT